MDPRRYPTLSRIRRRRQARSAGVLLSAALLLGVALVTAGLLGAFASTNASPSNTISAASDWVAPVTSRSVVGKSQGGTAGFIKSGGTYHVYAEVNDTGNPASGIASVEAASGSVSVALASGSFSFGGLSYGYRSAIQTLPASSEGSYTYQVSADDNAGNSDVTGGFSFTIDNTAPAAAGIQTANGGTIVGRPEINDTVTYSFSEPIEPGTVLSGWTGSQTNVVVRINNNAAATGGNDQVLIFNSTNSAQLPLGSVNLGRTDYVGANRTFGASGTRSRMTLSGNSITIVLGTQSGAGTTAAANGTMTWSPSTTPTDRAANNLSSGSLTESGSGDREF